MPQADGLSKGKRGAGAKSRQTLEANQEAGRDRGPPPEADQEAVQPLGPHLTESLGTQWDRLLEPHGTESRGTQGN